MGNQLRIMTMMAGLTWSVFASQRCQERQVRCSGYRTKGDRHESGLERNYFAWKAGRGGITLEGLEEIMVK